MQFHRHLLIKKPLSEWNSMIQASVRNGFFSESLNIYSSMLKAGVHGDNFTFPSVAKACGKLNSMTDGKKIHAHVILMGFQRNVYVQTALLDMYSKCSYLSAAHQLFDEMSERSLVSWNSIISMYCRVFKIDESLMLLKEMQLLSLMPSSSTLVSIVSGCCGSAWVLRQGLSIHCYTIKLGLDSDVPLSNSIISMYLRFDLVNSARSVFDLLVVKTNVSWTTIIGGYVKIHHFSEAFKLFHTMQCEQVSLDSITFVNLISCCAEKGALLTGSSVHAFVIKSGCDQEDIVINSLVSMYVKCGDLIMARRTFDLMHEKSVFLWTSMIGGYVRDGHADEALSLFESLLMTTVKPTEVTIATVLSACADYGSLSVGEKLEGYVKANGFESDLRVQTSLIHMYCKCGCIEKAKEIFDKVSNKDLAVWSSMINGYAMHGNGEEALSLFRKMLKEEAVEPDAIVFTDVLSACSHSGLVEEGLKYFYSMQRDFNIQPSIEHYLCLVDLLGRAGYLTLASKAIQQMPIEMQTHALAPFLSACRTHGGIQLRDTLSKHLCNLKPQNTNHCILMANIYASLGKWNEAAEMRRLIDDRGLVKVPGLSMIEANV